MEKTKKVMVRVNPNAYSEDVFVLIPPKYWNIKGLAECVKLAIEGTFDRSSQGDDDGKTH